MHAVISIIVWRLRVGILDSLLQKGTPVNIDSCWRVL